VSAALHQALGAVRSWPAPHAAAAVVGPAGILAAEGDVERVFRLASVTKPLAALAVLVAVEEDAVGLDTAADDDLLPGATLRHLLAHASGLAMDQYRRAFPPAVRRVYSNVGMERAAALVERGTELPFAHYFEEAVVRSLQLSGTSLPGSPARDGCSTVADLARALHELISPSGLLHPSTLTEARSVQFPGLRGVVPGYGSQDPNDWGLGFEIRGQKSPHWTGSANSPATYGHFGQSGTMAWIDPVAGVGLVALTDRDFCQWAKDAWPALSDAVLAAL
jgi:CubicO group peptidase (beta-lactamase class C family)